MTSEHDVNIRCNNDYLRHLDCVPVKFDWSSRAKRFDKPLAQIPADELRASVLRLSAVSVRVLVWIASEQHGTVVKNFVPCTIDLCQIFL